MSITSNAEVIRQAKERLSTEYALVVTKEKVLRDEMNTAIQAHRKAQRELQEKAAELAQAYHEKFMSSDAVKDDGQ